MSCLKTRLLCYSWIFSYKLWNYEQDIEKIVTDSFRLKSRLKILCMTSMPITCLILETSQHMYLHINNDFLYFLSNFSETTPLLRVPLYLLHKHRRYFYVIHRRQLYTTQALLLLNTMSPPTELCCWTCKNIYTINFMCTVLILASDNGAHWNQIMCIIWR